jgi:signal transduction histidine kinase
VISDNGPGIPPKLRSRVFEPFFTTKPVGGGTGIGLSICHAVVTAHGGSIELDETPGGGATFAIRLPVVAVQPAGGGDTSRART